MSRSLHSDPRVGRARALVLAALVLASCAGGRADAPGDAGAGARPASAPEAAAGGAAATTGSPQVWGYEVVRSHPHDTDAFTQGLTFHGGYLYEGTGRRGASSVRRVDIDSGAVLQKVDLPPTLFGEGIAIAGERLYQLTWTARIGYVYRLETLEPVGRFEQVTDGWGLTWDGSHLIQSDGSQRLWFLDPDGFAPVRSIDVLDEGRPLRQINELEYVDGEIWANVWHSEALVRIDPRDGRVLGRIDLTGLLDSVAVRDPEAVLNGIAHDPESGRIWVTGKLWPSLFEIRVRRP